MTMRTLELSVPKLATIAATRGMLGFGAGLLSASVIPRAERKTVGWTLLVIGALSTIPLAMSVFAGKRRDVG
jgi:urea transporter